MRRFWLLENTSLLVSAVFAGLFAAAGIAWGLWMGSLMILFDGAYSLLSLLLSLMAVYVGRLVRRPGNARFPFGYAALQPLAIAVKGIAITLVCVVSFASAVKALLQGGQPLATELALLFTLINVIGCAVCLGYLRWVARWNASELVRAEYQQWMMDTVLSVAVLFGFAIALLLEHTRWAAFAAYADPVMVILIAGYFIWIPLRMTAGALRELVLAAPPAPMREHVARILKEEGVEAHQARMTKVGPYLLLELVVAPDQERQAGALRFRLYRRLTGLTVRPLVLIRAASEQGADWPALDAPGRQS